MIGAGALGFEFLKIFTLMGIGANKNKFITFTDNDKIEMSNLILKGKITDSINLKFLKRSQKNKC